MSEIGIEGGGYGGVSPFKTPLMQMMGGPDIEPGDEPSYQLCKTIYLYHPLGAKMAEAPITLAQSQEREITVQDAPEEVKQAFIDEWQNLDADGNILNVHALSRVYGISALVVGVRDYPSEKPLEMEKLWEQDIFFHTLDPLNTAGSLVLSQSTSDANFQKPTTVRSGGLTYHPSRFQVVMNERPIFISYTASAFGFVGRSVYQRALYAMKSFLSSMIADDMILKKLGVIISKQKSPGSVVNQMMQKVGAIKRMLLKLAQTWNVLTIDVDEEIETLNMQNVDGAGTYARTNCLKNIATAADMPAKLLENETMVSGFGEGTEDSKNNARYIGGIRIKLRPTYKWFTNLVQYRAWNPQWYKSVIQTKYPDYKDVPLDVAFSEWRKNFVAEWPSLLIEPESDAVEREAVIFEATIALLNSLIPQLDPQNKARVIQWACDCFGENKRLFPHELELDWSALETFIEENQDKTDEAHEAAMNPEEKGKFPSFKDSSPALLQLDGLRARVAVLAAKRRQKKLPAHA